jgi:ABC-type dipeptide/oligopeptide/nickel transport system ATPase component
MNVLELQDLSITYQGTKEAAKHISFAVPEKSIVAIVGESGSGKSTIIRATIGLLTAGGEISGGKILFCGEDLQTFSKEQMRKARGEEMAMIFQDAGSYLNPRRKIGSQFVETLRVHQDISKEEARAQAKAMLSRLKLADPERIMKSYAFQLSGGMRQRVAIAMAMAMHPKLLLADEPTSALDVTIQAQVVQEMLDMRESLGTAIVIVTHNMGVASRMADYIAVMQNGNLMEFGTRDQVIDHPQSSYTKKLLSVVPELEE